MANGRLSAKLDPATRAWWRLVGRRVDLAGEHRWLDAPTCGPGPVAASWLTAEADRIGGVVREEVAGGLLPSMSVLDGSGFRASELDHMVRHFYEHTAGWRMEAWAQWSALFQPGGALVSRFFGRRVQQLALPIRPLDVAHGIDSRVVRGVPVGVRQRAGLPAPQRAGRRFAGAVLAVRSLRRRRSLCRGPGRSGCLRRACPLRERFHVYQDHRGVLRTDRELRLYRALVLRLHYRMELV